MAKTKAPKPNVTEDEIAFQQTWNRVKNILIEEREARHIFLAGWLYGIKYGKQIFKQTIGEIRKGPK
jgi:hypothetical protein